MTLRFRAHTEGEPWNHTMIRKCVYCQHPIRWMSTYEAGNRRCFDADPVPRDLDDGSGWLPGTFTVDGREVLVLAPLAAHSPEKRLRAPMVVHPHLCTGRPNVAA